MSLDRTQVGDPKNLVETQPPGADRLLVVLRVGQSSGDPTPFIPLDELSLDIRHGPGVENTLEGGSETMSLVLLMMPIDLSRLTGLVQFLSARHPTKRSTDIRAQQPEPDRLTVES